MRHSETVDSISPAWVMALNEMVDIPRDNVADTGSYKYRYADLAAAAQQARQVLAAHELAVHQEASGEHLGDVSVVTRVWHSSGQWIEADPLVLPAKGGPQDVGSAISYGRRYALMAFLGLATDDDDGAGAQAAATEAAKPHPLSGRVAKVLADFKRLTDTDKETLKDWADGRKLSGAALLGDEVWLSHVEAWLDETHDRADVAVTAGQIKKMAVCFREQGITERDDRLRFIVDVVGRDVGSSKELTKVEASQVIDALGTVDDPGPPVEGDLEQGELLGEEYPG